MRRKLFFRSVLLPLFLAWGTTAFGFPGETATAKPAAQATKSSSTKAKSGTKSTTTKSTSLPRAAFKGTVTALDPTAKTVTVKGKAGKDVTFYWIDLTTVKPNGKTSETVEVGDLVEIKYTSSGSTKTATQVFVDSEDSGGGHGKGTCLCADGTYLKKCCAGGEG